MPESECSIANFSIVATSRDVEKVVPASNGLCVAKYLSRELVVECRLDSGNKIVSDGKEGAAVDESFAVFETVARIGFAGNRGGCEREIAIELLEFSIKEHRALAMNEMDHSLRSVSVQTVRAYECIVKAHDRSDQVVERVTNVVFVVVWKNESVWIARASEIGAGIGN